MKCETVADRIPQIAAGTLPEDEQRACMQHIAGCDTCTMALKGATAMWTVRNLPEEPAPDGLFERMMSSVAQANAGRASGRRFWLGAGFGGAIGRGGRAVQISACRAIACFQPGDLGLEHGALA